MKTTDSQAIDNLHMIAYDHEERLKVLEGMKGPERHLVGDVAERIPRPDVVEDDFSGRRGVGEIVGALELREYLDLDLSQALRKKNAASTNDDIVKEAYYEGMEVALERLQEWLTSRTAKRSDLSNSYDQPSGIP